MAADGNKAKYAISIRSFHCKVFSIDRLNKKSTNSSFKKVTTTVYNNQRVMPQIHKPLAICHWRRRRTRPSSVTPSAWRLDKNGYSGDRSRSDDFVVMSVNHFFRLDVVFSCFSPTA